jgi:RHS repeat-associated protein
MASEEGASFLGQVIADRLCRKEIFRCSANGGLTSTKLPAASGQAVYTHVTDVSGRITRTVDPDGVVTSLSYDTAGRLLSATDGAGGVSQFGYDADGRQVTARDPAGIVVTTQYDAFDRVTGTKFATETAYLSKTTFSDEAHLETSTDARGFQRTTKRDLKNRTRRVTEPDGSYTEEVFDAVGNTVSQRDHLGRTTTFEYDRANRLERSTAANGAVTKYTYNGSGQRLSMTEAFGTDLARTTDYHYDNAGRLDRITYPDGNYTRYEYDLEGNRTLVASPSGTGGETQTRYVYDPVGRVTDVTGPDSVVTHSEYTPAGRLKSVSVGYGTDAVRTTSYAYDRGRLQSRTDPDGVRTDFAYDNVGRVIRETRAAGTAQAAQTTYQYDSLGRRTLVGRAKSPSGRADTSYTYDRNGNVTKLSNPDGKAWCFVYDSRDRLTALGNPSRLTTTFTYDAVGNLTGKLLPDGRRVSTTYDCMNRPVGVVASRADGTVERSTSNTYDALGRLTCVSDGSLVSTREYDAADRILAINHAHLDKRLQFSYNGAGNRIGLSVSSLSGATGSVALLYGRDPLGRLNSIQPLAGLPVQVQYTGLGQRSEVTLPNGVVSKHQYDKEGRVTSILYQGSSGQTVARYQLTYDSRGNVTGVVDDAGATSASFDLLDQLTNVAYPGTPVSADTFTYSNAGNRGTYKLYSAGVTTTLQYAYDHSDRLLSIAGPQPGNTRTFTHLPGGEISSRLDSGTSQPISYTWSVLGQLLGLRLPTGDQLDLAYEPPAAGGLRWRQQTVTGAETAELRSLYDLDGNLLADLDASNNLTRIYLSGDELDDTFGHFDPATGATAWYVRDHLGSVRKVLDASGAVVPGAEQRFGAFGELQGSGIPAGASRLGFTGRDGTSNPALVYLRNRWYDPATGRFLSQDPLLQDPAAAVDFIKRQGVFGANPYIYCGNNPLSRRDPTGLEYDPWAFASDEQIERDSQFISNNPEIAFGVWGAGFGGALAAGTGLAGGALVKTTADYWRKYICSRFTQLGVRLGASGVVAATAGFWQITFGHGARHLGRLGPAVSQVEAAIRAEIQSLLVSGSVTGPFWGRVTVQGVLIEFRAFVPQANWINVGTYYAVR